MPNTIVPSVGRIVWFRRAGQNEVLPAIVTRVHSNDCINLKVFEDRGGPDHFASSCVYVDADQPVPPSNDSWHWMPYQIAAAKDRDERTGEPK